MAKITTGPIVSDIRNKLGDVVFFRNRAGQASRAYFKTLWPGTDLQQNIATNFLSVMSAYQNDLTDIQRQGWAHFAISFPNRTSINGVRPLTPQQAFLRTNLPLGLWMGTQLNDPPLNMDVLQPTGCSITTNNASPDTLEVSVSPNHTANEIVILALTPPLSPGILRFEKCYLPGPPPAYGGAVALESLSGPATWPYNIFPAWKAFYDTRTPPTGTLVVGKRIGLLAYFLNTTNGALSQALKTSSITTGEPMYQTKFTLTPAQIKTLFSVGTEVIPTPGPGKCIVVNKVLLYYVHVTTPYTIGGGSSLTLSPTGDPTVKQQTLTLSGVITVAATKVALMQEWVAAWTAALMLNQGLFVKCTVQDPTLGDGTLELVIDYTISTP